MVPLCYHRKLAFGLIVSWWQFQWPFRGCFCVCVTTNELAVNKGKEFTSYGLFESLLFLLGHATTDAYNQKVTSELELECVYVCLFLVFLLKNAV